VETPAGLHSNNADIKPGAYVEFAGTCPEFMGDASSPELPARILGD